MHDGMSLKPGFSLHSQHVEYEATLDVYEEMTGGGGMSFADVSNAGESSCNLPFKLVHTGFLTMCSSNHGLLLF